MAHITEFTVEGLAGKVGSYSRKLNLDINVFCGPNGSGKTSLLKIFHAAMRENADPLWTVPFKRAEVKVYSITFDKVFTYTCEKPDEPVPESSEHEAPVESVQDLTFRTYVTLGQTAPRLKWHVEPSQKTETPGFAHRYLPTTRLYLAARPRTIIYGETSYIAEEDLEESFATLLNQAWSAYSAGVLGSVQRAQAKGLADILVGILTAKSTDRGTVGDLDQRIAYERVAKFLERQGSKAVLGDPATFQNNYLSNPLLRNVVGDISTVEEHIQKEMASREKLQVMLERMFTGNKSLRFTDASIEILGAGGRKIGLERLSSGEKHLLRILIDTLSVGPSSLIVDEPELSMHVDWQKLLIPVMRELNGSAQLIMATHSPEIISDISDDKVFNL